MVAGISAGLSLVENRKKTVKRWQSPAPASNMVVFHSLTAPKVKGEYRLIHR